MDRKGGIVEKYIAKYLYFVVFIYIYDCGFIFNIPYIVYIVQCETEYNNCCHLLLALQKLQYIFICIVNNKFRIQIH